jgi:integrase
MPRQTRERFKLDRQFMRSLTATGKLHEYPDEAMPALEVRVTPKGSASYSLRYQKPDGSQGRKTIAKWPATTPAEARDIARRELSVTPVKTDALAEQVRKKSARATAQRIAGTITLERFLIERYEDHLKAHGKTGTRQAQMIRSGFAHLLNRDLSEIHAWDIEKWRSERLKAGSSPSTCNRLINALRGALSRAIEWKLLEAAVNPLKPVKKQKEPEPDGERYLTAEEEARLRAALASHEAALNEQAATPKRGKRRRARHVAGTEASYADETTPLVLLALNIACRRGELLALEWSRVDLAHARVTFGGDTTKSGKTRVLALNREALDVLTRWRAQCAPDAHYVFPDGSGAPLTEVKAWPKVRDAAHITRLRLRFHDLRHHAASRLAMGGVDIYTVSRILGHASPKMSARYSHLSPGHLAAAMAVLDEANPVQSTHDKNKAG